MSTLTLTPEAIRGFSPATRAELAVYFGFADPPGHAAATQDSTAGRLVGAFAADYWRRLGSQPKTMLRFIALDPRPFPLPWPEVAQTVPADRDGSRRSTLAAITRVGRTVTADPDFAVMRSTSQDVWLHPETRAALRALIEADEAGSA